MVDRLTAKTEANRIKKALINEINLAENLGGFR
jgi:hypothetical protein